MHWGKVHNTVSTSQNRELNLYRRSGVRERRVKGPYLLHLRELPLFVLRSASEVVECYIHTLTQSGQLLLVRNHFDIQSRWNTCPQLPQAMLRPSSEAADGLAWNSILASCRLFLHIAHVSVHIDHDHTATALHCDSGWDNDFPQKNAYLLDFETRVFTRTLHRSVGNRHGSGALTAMCCMKIPCTVCLRRQFVYCSALAYRSHWSSFFVHVFADQPFSFV